MERQEKAKQAGAVAKKATKPTRDTKLQDVSVKRTGVREAKPSTRAQVKKSAGPISVERRRQLIAEAAYFRALSRGFEGGDAVEDWLVAEREVDKSLAKSAD
ncbi:MAG: DUF2934 domain-containing protein [Chromatiales bacterium]|nr:MAG: DUF2934 domain-containing protein [Chromatiales bacterium]